MTNSDDNSNLPDIFKNVDPRVFAFGRDKLPHKDKPINSIKYARLKYIIDKLEGEYFKQRPFNGFKLARYFLDKVRKYQIDGVQYVWPYESRWETNETLGKELGGFTEPMTYRQIRTAFDQAKHYGLIHNPASQGDRLRLFRLHDDLIAMEKMTDEQIGQYIISQNKHRPQKSKYIDRRSRSTLTAEVEVHRPQKSIELNKESNQEYNNLIKQLPNGYPQADGHMPQKQSDDLTNNDAVTESDNDLADPSWHSDRVLNDVDKNDMDLGKMDIHKRDIITAWRKEFFQTTNGKALYPFFGADFFDVFYKNLADYLTSQGHNKKTHLIPELSIAIFDVLIFGASDDPHKQAFETYRTASDVSASTYLQTDGYKKLLEHCYQGIDKPLPDKVVPNIPKLERPDKRPIQALAEKIKGMGMSTDQATRLAVKFDQEFGKQMTRLKIATVNRDKILLDIVGDDKAWAFVKMFWRDNRFIDQLWTDSSMQSLLKRSDTYQQITQSNTDQGAANLISMVKRHHARQPKGMIVR